jgi:DNA methylase
MGELLITSPKRDREGQSGWEGFFPYYAGYPARFATDVIRTAGLVPRSSVLDPWNGSGTTTYAAAQLGHTAIGLDLNPVMIVIARARMLSPSESDSLLPLCKEIVRGARAKKMDGDEPLQNWFDVQTAAHLRGVEQSIQRCLVGIQTQSNLDHLSSMAATFYAALFSVCRDLTAGFQSSNPTWIRVPRAGNNRVSAEKNTIAGRFAEKLRAMSHALSLEAKKRTPDLTVAACRVGDSTDLVLQESSIDLVLGSPPYCTRIDYTAATRVELAVLSCLTQVDVRCLAKRMIGSTRVPKSPPAIDDAWGPTCLRFIERVKRHPSKASAGYYYKTHVDYFDKMFRSLRAISAALRPHSKAVLVVQDSYYKEIHNPLPSVFIEMATRHSMALHQRMDFVAPRSMGSVNSSSRKYRVGHVPVESVLCFQKRN